MLKKEFLDILNQKLSLVNDKEKEDYPIGIWDLY